MKVTYLFTFQTLTIMKVLILLFHILLEDTEALKCYKCAKFGLSTPKKCLNVDNSTKVQTCADNEPYCIAAGYNYQPEDGPKEFINIRRCGEKIMETYCIAIKYAYNENDIRNCHVCTKDLCNNGPLIHGFEGSLPDKPDEPDTPDKPDTPDQPDGPSGTGGGSIKAEGSASADSDGNVKAGGGVSAS